MRGRPRDIVALTVQPLTSSPSPLLIFVKMNATYPRVLLLINLIRNRNTPVPDSAYLEKIQFHYFNDAAEISYTYNLYQPVDEFDTSFCDTRDKYALVTHGYQQSCREEWMTKLVKNLIKYRGGCIICMDYSEFNQMNYLKFVKHFDPFAQVMTQQLQFLEQLGFDPAQGFLYGFSLGANLVLRGAQNYGYQRIQAIDVCDISGRLFKRRDFKSAAKNVQCVHTSSEYGIRDYSGCHQNWRMGKCGTHQVAAKERPFRSHGLCPIMYNLAFEHEFLAAENADNCSSTAYVATYPYRFRMGYTETRKKQVVGQLFANTTEFYPFTLDGEIYSTDFDEYEIKLSKYFSINNKKGLLAPDNLFDYDDDVVDYDVAGYDSD